MMHIHTQVETEAGAEMIICARHSECFITADLGGGGRDCGHKNGKREAETANSVHKSLVFHTIIIITI